MNVGLGIAIYFILWWTVLFAVLPWGVRSQKEAGEAPEGTDLGAPVLPRLLIKAVATTIISAALFAIGFGVWKAGWVSIDSLPMPYGRLKL
jgi:predicted secreted protein